LCPAAVAASAGTLAGLSGGALPRERQSCQCWLRALVASRLLSWDTDWKADEAEGGTCLQVVQSDSGGTKEKNHEEVHARVSPLKT